jgi:hypothetical protein
MGKRTNGMQTRAKQIQPHYEDLVAGVHEDLKAKGVEGLRVSAIHFVPAGNPQCGPGTAWDCKPDPTTGGVRCGCYPVKSDM